ncbi:MAG: hypothetical protein RJA61_612 [Candidatus Parcubacteria bacterium]|jgi:hypothetical protein
MLDLSEAEIERLATEADEHLRSEKKPGWKAAIDLIINSNPHLRSFRRTVTSLVSKKLHEMKKGQLELPFVQEQKVVHWWEH